MLDVLKEIDEVRKERVYFHELSSEDVIEGTITTVGKALDVRGVVVLRGKEMEQVERNLYKKVLTVIEYRPEKVKYSNAEEKLAVSKSFKDTLFKHIVRYMQGLPFMGDGATEVDVANEIKNRIEKDGVVESIEGMELVTLDDGIQSIHCLVGEGEIEKGGLYEVTLRKSEYLTDEFMVLRTEEHELYGLDKAKRICADRK